jgi:hypothetical protein
MGLIEQEIMELRSLAKEVMMGTITDIKASLMLGVYNQTSKRVSQMIQITAMQIKEGKNGKAYRRMVSSNLISDGAAIMIESKAPEMVRCFEQGGKCISRADCLDYSGAEHHINTCQICEQFSVTRKQIYPN